MALAIDASSPAVATQTTNTTATVTTASFTPPAGSVLLVLWSCDALGTPSAPSITDNLGTPLTYTRTDWQSIADAPTAHGQAAAWTAPVASSAAMTVTVTSGSASGERIAAVKILVITGADTTTPFLAHGKSGSTSAASIAQSYTAQATNAWGFIGVNDFDQVGAETAGTGCTLIASANVGTAITYGFVRRTTADDVNGNSNTLNVTLPSTSTNLNWVYVEIQPAAAASSIPWGPQRTASPRDPGEVWWIQRDRRDANTVATAANPLVAPLDSAWQAGGGYWHRYNTAVDLDARVWQPQQRVYISDPNLLSAVTADPLLVGGGVGGDTWRRYSLPDYADRREVPQQRAYVSDPNLLATAELENELLGSGDDLRRRYEQPAYYDRREVPQQRLYVSDPLLLTTAQLENELLGGAGTALRANVPATHAPRWWMPQQPPRWTVYFDAGPDVPPLTLAFGDGGGYWARYNQAGWQPDRREVPQQRLYISDPSFYPTVAPTDPLTVAWGDGGTYWTLYNTAALFVDRRLVPQQRRYVSDPALLASALLENELLGSADDRWRRYGQWFTDRREAPQQRGYLSDPGLLGPPPTDPLTVAAGVGGDLWRRANTPAYADRREVPQQPGRVTLYFDAGPGTPPLTLSAGAGGNLWHLYQWRRPARSWWQPRPVFAPLGNPCIVLRPFSGTTGRPGSGTTARPNTGTTADPC